MHWPRGVRARLAGALVLLVALTAVVLGVGASVFVDARLHDQALQDAAAQARFDLTVTVPGRQLPDRPTVEDIIRSGLTDTFRRRNVESVIDLGGSVHLLPSLLRAALRSATSSSVSHPMSLRASAGETLPTPGSTLRVSRPWSSAVSRPAGAWPSISCEASNRSRLR